jgi:8-oxo-dGTP diphosphatase / 2-hydroxy-dATP diphosphatase
MRKILTLCIIHRSGRVLLGMKKRGFGQGLWNGFGGKIHQGESLEEAALRECQEEAGIVPQGLIPKGTLTFSYTQNPDAPHEVHVFATGAFTGQPVETEEMRPRWFAQDAIPYDSMWPDDKYWLPLLLEGKSFAGSFVFDETATILDYNIRTL